MNFHSRASESRTIPNIILGICLLGFVAVAILAYANGTSIFKAVAGVTPPARAAAAPASFPCDLPTVEGERAIAVVDIRGGVLNLTCSSTRPLLKPITPKGGK